MADVDPVDPNESLALIATGYASPVSHEEDPVDPNESLALIAGYVSPVSDEEDDVRKLAQVESTVHGNRRIRPVVVDETVHDAAPVTTLPQNPSRLTYLKSCVVFDLMKGTRDDFTSLKLLMQNKFGLECADVNDGGSDGSSSDDTTEEEIEIGDSEWLAYGKVSEMHKIMQSLNRDFSSFVEIVNEKFGDGAD